MQNWKYLVITLPRDTEGEVKRVRRSDLPMVDRYIDEKNKEGWEVVAANTFDGYVCFRRREPLSKN